MSGNLALGPQVLLRWRVGRHWTKKWHLVEPGLGVGNSHSRMLCGMLRQPSYNAAEVAISTFPFEAASAFAHYGERNGEREYELAGVPTRVANPDVCAGCRHELQKQAAA